MKLIRVIIKDTDKFEKSFSWIRNLSIDIRSKVHFIGSGKGRGLVRILPNKKFRECSKTIGSFYKVGRRDFVVLTIDMPEVYL